jgi:hypothetical protein
MILGSEASKRYGPRNQGPPLVARGGIEPPTYRFSGGRSYQLSYLAVPGDANRVRPEPGEVYRTLPARPDGFASAASGQHTG